MARAFFTTDAVLERVQLKDKTLSSHKLYLVKRLNEIKREGLAAFAREVRRRARIRISLNRVTATDIEDYRYDRKLKDTISWVIGDESVTFEVGGVPYVGVEDQDKTQETVMWGNPTMRFHWYRLGQNWKVTAPRVVRRSGKNFFTGAFTGAIDDFEKIFGRVLGKELARK